MATDDFLAGLGSPEGQRSEQALFEVMDSLENCRVEPSERVIVWDDGTAYRSHKRHVVFTYSRIHPSLIDSHVVGWLEMHYVPEGLNEQQMEQFELMIHDWIQDHGDSQSERSDPE